MALPQLHVAVVGGGLAGLAAAIGLSKAGHLVTVFEQAAKLGEVRPLPTSINEVEHRGFYVYITIQMSR